MPQLFHTSEFVDQRGNQDEEVVEEDHEARPVGVFAFAENVVGEHEAEGSDKGSKGEDEGGQHPETST